MEITVDELLKIAMYFDERYEKQVEEANKTIKMEEYSDYRKGHFENEETLLAKQYRKDCLVVTDALLKKVEMQ